MPRTPALAPIETRYHAQFEHHVCTAPGIYMDRLAITSSRLGPDAIDHCTLPSTNGFPALDMLRARGWRPMSDFTYLAGPNLYRTPVEPAPGVPMPVLVACPDQQVRAVTHVAFRPGQPDRFVATDGTEWKTAACLPALRQCVHGQAAAARAAGDPVTACGRKEPGQRAGVFNDEGCVEAYDCAVEAANTAARFNTAEQEPAGDLLYTWSVLCADHEEQPADGCQECHQA
ncbi:hypothetical protein ACWCQB_37670 [Streptomyces hirsutus]